MLLKTLRLANFRQFKDEEIEFELGLTAIVGANGSGKTTILEAVAWVLYGKMRGDKDGIRNKWCTDERDTEVELAFRIGNREYLVQRDLKKATFKETTDGRDDVQATTLTGVTEYSEQVIGLTYEQFKNSFCTEQKQLDFLKFSNQEKKQEEVAKMLGYDALRVAGKRADDKAKNAKAELKGLEEALSGGIDKEAELKNAKEALALCSKELAELCARAETHVGKLALSEPKATAAVQALDLIRQMDERKDVGRLLKEKLDELKLAGEKLKKEAEERIKLEPLAQEWESLQKLVGDKRSQLAQSAERQSKETLLRANESEKNQAELELKSAPTADVDKTAREVAECEAALLASRQAATKAETDWKLEQAQTAAAVGTIESQIVALTDDLQVVEESEARGECSTCGQPLPDGHAPRSDKLRAELKTLTEGLVHSKQLVEALSKQPVTVETALANQTACETKRRAAQSAQGDVAMLAQARDSLGKRIETLSASIAELAKAIAALPPAPNADELARDESKLAELEPARTRFVQLSNVPARMEEHRKATDNAQSSFEEERQRQQQASEKLKDLGMDKACAEAALEEHRRLEQEGTFIQTNLDLRKKDVEAQKALVERAERDLADFAEKRKRAKELEREQNLYAHLDKGMSELRQKLNQELPGRLCAHASEALSALTGGRYVQIKLDSKLNPKLIDDDDVEKDVISGGEEDIVALALRLGLTSMMQDSGGQPMSLLILDEVFGSLDDERRVHVMEMLDTLRHMFEQVLFISHIDDVRNAADRWLEVVYDRNAKCSHIVSKYREIEPL